MMNPNVFAQPPPPLMQQQQPLQTAAQSSLPPGGQNWPPQQTTAAAPSFPPTNNLPTPQQQGLLNGNYQQQLSSSLSGLSLKQTPQASIQQQQQVPQPQQLNAPFNNANQVPPSSSVTAFPPTSTSLTNGPSNPQQQQLSSSVSGSIAPSTATNNNYVNAGALPAAQSYTNGPIGKPSLYPPSSTPGVGPIAPPGTTQQSIAGGQNQMTLNSANLPGLPHMPPPQNAATAPSFAPPSVIGRPPLQQQTIPGQLPGQQQSIPGQQQSIPGQQQQPPMVGQPSLNAAPMSGFPPKPSQQQQQAGFPPQPTQQQPVFPQQQQPGFPPQPTQQQQPGFPPQPTQQQQPGFPPLSTQQQQSNFPPQPPQQQQPGFPPQPLQQQQPGFPPQPTQQQQPGFPPQPTQQQQPGFPPQPTQQQQPGFPPQQPGFPPQPLQQQQPGFPPQPQQPQPGFRPQPGAYPQQPGYHQQQQQTGYPPKQPGFPGQLPQPGFNQQQQPSMYQQPQPQRRLDPDQMPNPTQVMIDNQHNAGGTFVTNQVGLLPPLVTTKCVVQDQGNSSPRFLRSSLYCIPSTADLLKTTALPFTLIVSPYARIVEGEYEPPIVDFGELGPIRCNRCKAYMSPNMQFVDAGRRFQCLMCKVSTEVPNEYFQHLDHTGQRVDKYERPELVLGTYEFLATKDYCRNNTTPQIPAFIFVIDVSYNTIKSGLVHLICSQMKNVLKHLPLDQGQDKSQVRVGFITYNSCVHFYNIKSTLAQPQMMVVGDVQDMFMPLLDGFLCHPEESEAVIDALMEQIPKMFVDTKETETILYPAIQAGLEALKASNCAGKLLIFNSTLPIAEAPGKLKNRDDRKLLATEKEKTVLTPQCQSYNTLGHECVQNGCSVDLFLFNNAYIDIATIGQVSRLTGGEVFKYTYFQADVDGKRLVEDIIKNVSRPIVFDAVMRVRTSAGIRATDFYGHFFMSNTTDVELASLDATKSIAIEIKHDDKLPPEESVYLQIALLFTSCSGQRRLRILNLALTATTTIADVFKSCDLDAIMLFLAKQSCVKLLELTPKAVKDNLIHRSAQILACYRKHCTSPTSAGQLILPECLKLMPLYLSCLLKNDAISGGSDMTLDDRSYVMQFVLSMDLNMWVYYLYPRFIPIHNVEADDNDLPTPIRCTHEKMFEDGAYILENGVYLFVWLGQSLPQNFIQPLFGVQCTQQVNAERFAISGDTPLARRVRSVIENLMNERTRYMRITCVRQNDKLEGVFRHFLVEDRGTDGSASYVDFLCHMHKEIKDFLS